jgi:hypothetical protein
MLSSWICVSFGTTAPTGSSQEGSSPEGLTASTASPRLTSRAGSVARRLARAGRDRLQRRALPVGITARLDQGQEPGQPGDAARTRAFRAGRAMTGRRFPPPWKIAVSLAPVPPWRLCRFSRPNSRYRKTQYVGVLGPLQHQPARAVAAGQQSGAGRQNAWAAM